MMAIIYTIHFILLLATSIIVWAQQAKVRDSDLPYAINDLRLKPDFCTGFHITYPAKHGEKLTWGEMGYLSWEVDTAMEKSPDLITRLRLVDDIGRNTQLIGENITIRTDGNKGALVFPVNVHYVQGLQNYRIAVQHPGEAIHCVYESVPLTVIPRRYERYTNHDSAIPTFAVPNARRIVAA